MVEIDWHFFECRFHFFFLPDCFLFSTVVVVVVVGLARIQKEMSSRVQRERVETHCCCWWQRYDKNKSSKDKTNGVDQKKNSTQSQSSCHQVKLLTQFQFQVAAGRQLLAVFGQACFYFIF